MDSGLYAACAGLVARTQALDIEASNLANLNTSGYKAQLSTFRSVLANSSDGTADALSKSVNDFGVLGDARTDLLQGAMERTGSDLDFALEGSGWFVVQSGSDRIYTRNGNFHVSRAGQLVTSDGKLVLGTMGPILVPPGHLSVSADGTISVDGGLAGQLKTVQFAKDTVLAPAGASYFRTSAQNEQHSEAKVLQGSLEGSNVNGISAAVALVSLQRHADLLQQALTTFHSNFNRIAAQDLSRV